MAKQTEGILCQALFLTLLCICNVFGGFSPPQLTRSLRTEFICDRKYKACAPSENASFPNLVHITAAGPNDTLHYLIGTIGVPTLLVARTTVNATMDINLDHLMTGNFSQLGNNTIVFDPEPLDVYAVLFTTVYEYNDVNDTADLGLMDNDPSYWRHHYLGDLQWMPSKDISPNGTHIICLNVSMDWTANKNRTDPFVFQDNGTFSLKFEFKTTNDRNDELPRLEFNANNTQVEVVFDDLQSAFNNSRFALELAFINNATADKEMDLTKTKSIDDEYTPGVFEMVDWTTRLNQTTGAQSSGGYMQWKPVCYKSLARSIHNVTKQFYYDLEKLTNHTLEQTGAEISLAYAYFGPGLMANQFSMSTTNVSFGLSKDKFYRDTNYTISTFTIGFGSPPADQVSLMIKLVIAIGLGVPVLLIIVGGIGVCVKKNKERRDNDFTSSYQAIN